MSRYFIDEVVLHQRLGKIATADDLEIPARLLLQLDHFLGDISLDQRRVIPLEGFFQGR